jgi:signal transduction histidine kinase
MAEILGKTSDEHLRIGAHVLVQLGRELVTDAEQAILECVKNAYDADAPTCRIILEPNAEQELVHEATASRITKFRNNFETAKVTFSATSGEEVADLDALPPDTVIRRIISCKGRVVIEDMGDGLSPDQVRNSWLVISKSAKRNEDAGPKRKTRKGRTPLGDKGVGRLGTMRIGDVLLLETATDEAAPITSAFFRWSDCDVADTLDQIPVSVDQNPNLVRFKGTRVTVLGLRDLEKWRAATVDQSLINSLSRMISPFEAQATFQVSVVSSGRPPVTLAGLTHDTLKQSVADFQFEWHQSDDGNGQLIATANIRRGLFERSPDFKKISSKGWTAEIDEFLKSQFLKKAFPNCFKLPAENGYYISATRVVPWSAIRPDKKPNARAPGPFKGSLHYFFFGSHGQASGTGVSREMIANYAGVSILRDGFQVRQPGDWLKIAEAMTSGSFFDLRTENTVGRFDITGEHNSGLIEKSDREGFVENSEYNGFFSIATECRNFANLLLRGIRKDFATYVKKLNDTDSTFQSSRQAFRDARDVQTKAIAVRRTAEAASADLNAQVAKLDGDLLAEPTYVISIAKRAVEKLAAITEGLPTDIDAEALDRIETQIDDANEKMLSLYESAAVGLAARGLAHELRTHLTEIRKQAEALEKLPGNVPVTAAQLTAPVRAIRLACSAIASTASLIDPMLPRTRAVKEKIQLRNFLSDYFDKRRARMEQFGITVNVSTSKTDLTVRMNRSRLLQVVDNLVQNSIYWIRRWERLGEHRGEKLIKVEITERGFILSDSGPGVDPNYEGTLFDLFVTAKPDRDSGQGLGLYIVTELLAADSCAISLLPDRNSNGRRFRFEVDLSSLALEA